MKIIFNGTIDCNTEVELNHMTHGDFVVIEKFINTLKDSGCANVNATIKLTYGDNELLNDEI